MKIWKVMKIRCYAAAFGAAIMFCLLPQAKAVETLLYRATWSGEGDWANASFELSYQIGAVYASIGDWVFIAPWLGSGSTPAASRLDWTFDRPEELAYLNTGLSNAREDFWLLGYPREISVTPENCILDATQCAYGPIVGDPTVNFHRQPGSYLVDRMEVWLNPVSVSQSVTTRSGGFMLFGEVSPIPEVASYKLFSIGGLALFVTLKRSRNKLADEDKLQA